MKIAIVAAGFTPAEADELRSSMATFKAQGMVTKFEEKLVSGMIAKGLYPRICPTCFPPAGRFWQLWFS